RGVNPGECMVVFQYRNPIIYNSMGSFRRSAQNRRYLFRTPQHRHNQVGQVTAQVKHDTPFVSTEVFMIALSTSIVMTHTGMYFIDVSQPAFPYCFLTELNGGVSTEHVGNLKRKVFSSTSLQQPAV